MHLFNLYVGEDDSDSEYLDDIEGEIPEIPPNIAALLRIAENTSNSINIYIKQFYNYVILFVF